MKMSNRVPLYFSIDHLKEIFRDYCIEQSGEVGPEVSNMYVMIGDVPTNFDTLTIEFVEAEDER